ncbi:MAG: LysR family transcriptional regulator, partial [Chloroflexi bacterium]|nr:LysR family transcriptional regulator [Chloroflexota bacterium]
MDLARLEAFVEVSAARSFSRAAERLNLTQPTVSARIAQMEAQLGVGLFERLGRRVRLTDAGRALLPHAQRTLQAARDAAEAVHARRAGGGGCL